MQPSCGAWKRWYMLDFSRSVVGAVAVVLDQTPLAEQILQRVRKSLGLEQRGAADGAAGADDRIAGTDQNLIASLDRSDAILEFANKAIVQAFELRLPGLAQ